MALANTSDSQSIIIQNEINKLQEEIDSLKMTQNEFIISNYNNSSHEMKFIIMEESQKISDSIFKKKKEINILKRSFNY